MDGARNAQVTVSPTTIDLYLTVIQKSYTGKIFSSVACSQCPCYFLCSVYLHRSRILQFRCRDMESCRMFELSEIIANSIG